MQNQQCLSAGGALRQLLPSGNIVQVRLPGVRLPDASKFSPLYFREAEVGGQYAISISAVPVSQYGYFGPLHAHALGAFLLQSCHGLQLAAGRPSAGRAHIPGLPRPQLQLKLPAQRQLNGRLPGPSSAHVPTLLHLLAQERADLQEVRGRPIKNLLFDPLGQVPVFLQLGVLHVLDLLQHDHSDSGHDTER